ncbi:MAG: hypothetical protein U0800_06925 [Isosphaeraceae bacterium]
MSHELHYTSAPKGLKPGSKGFCTVACTASIPVVLAERLENLSGYRQVYPPHDPNAGRNPAARSHLLFSQGGQTLSILSRVGFAGLDYTDRSNKYAHHVALAPEERPEGGPAWLASQPGFLETGWQGEPRTIPQGRRPPRGDRPAARCGRWAQQAGDAGWAGVLAEAFLNNPRKVAYLIVPIDLDPLPLLAEALALVPPDRRWEVTFSTYFTTLPPGMACAWRCVLAGSPEAAQCRRMPDALVLDLTAPLGRAQDGPVVEQARTGIAPPTPKARPEAAAAETEAVRQGNRPRGDREPIGQGFGLIPDLPPPIPPGEKARLAGRRGAGAKRPPSPMTYQFAGILTACAALLVGGVLLIQNFLKDGGKGQGPVVQVAQDDPGPLRKPPQDDPPPPLGPEAGPKPPGPIEPAATQEPGKVGREATVTPPGPEKPEKRASPTPEPPGPGPDPEPDREGPKAQVGNGPRTLKFWGLPRRAGSQVGGSGRESSSTSNYAATRPIRGLRLIGLNDEPIQGQRLAVRPGEGGRSLKVVREGAGSGLVSGNEEMAVGTFRWEGSAIAFEMAPGVRDAGLLTAFFDCILEVQAEGGPPEYVYLTDPDALARERSGGEAARALSLPNSINWPAKNEKPEDVRFDPHGVFGAARSREASLSKSNRSLVLVSCKFHPGPQPHPAPWDGVLELVPGAGNERGKLVRPGPGKPRIAASIDKRSGHLKFEFTPPPPEIQAKYDEQDKHLAKLKKDAQPLNEKARNRQLTREEEDLGRELDAGAAKAEQLMKEYLEINAFSNQVIRSGLEITVGFEAGGELFVLPTIRSPRLAKESAPGGG